jgi:hypothetical protein
MGRLTTVVKWSNHRGTGPGPEAHAEPEGTTPMAEKTATKTEQTADVEVTPHPYCADGCGARVGSAKSTFLQGHDQRLISDLSFRVVDGEMGPFQRALLGLVDGKPTTGEFRYAEESDIMDRINAIDAAVAARFSVALAAKFTSAAMAKWAKWGKRQEREAAKAERAANPKPKRTRAPRAKAATEPTEPAPAIETDTTKNTVGQPIENLRGTTVKVKVGRWTYDATVVGMNQAGKITAVEYLNKKDEPTTTDRFKLVD